MHSILDFELSRNKDRALSFTWKEDSMRQLLAALLVNSTITEKHEGFELTTIFGRRLRITAKIFENI